MQILHADDALIAKIEAQIPYAPRTFKRGARLVIGFGHILRRGERYTELSVEGARHLLALDANWVGRNIERELGTLTKAQMGVMVEKCLLAGCGGADEIRAKIGVTVKRAA